MEPIAVLIAAIVGSAGISGALAGAVQFSRAARASRTIEQLDKARKEAPEGAASDALRRAHEHASLRLAAITLIPGRYGLVVAVALGGLVAIGVVGLLGTYGLPDVLGRDRDGDGVFEGSTSPRLFGMTVAVTLGYLLGVMVIVDQTLVRARRNFVRDAMGSNFEEAAQRIRPSSRA